MPTHLVSQCDDFIMHRLRAGESEEMLMRPPAYVYRSASHSGDDTWIVYARQPVGIDVAETPVPDNFLEIADTYFNETDQAALRAAPMPLQAIQFLRLWAQYEAKSKWLGTGLSEFRL